MLKQVLMVKLILVRLICYLLSLLVTVVMVTASGVKISIQGDEEEARSFTGEWLNDGGHRSEDDSDSDMESKTESSSRRVLTYNCILII